MANNIENFYLFSCGMAEISVYDVNKDEDFYVIREGLTTIEDLYKMLEETFYNKVQHNIYTQSTKLNKK